MQTMSAETELAETKKKQQKMQNKPETNAIIIHY